VRAADLERALDARWRGGWVIVKVPVSSDCAGVYTDNDARGTRVESRGEHDFEAGELGHVERVGTKWGGRVDVFLDLAEQILDSRRDGPYTLFDARSCKVQLKIDGAGKKGLPEAEAALAALLELHADAQEAEASPAWNRRRRADYPPDYERTLAEYRSWKAAQVVAATQARMSAAIEEAARIDDQIRDDAEYLTGFAAGVQRARDHSFGDCDDAAEARLYPDTTGGKSDRWDDGYEDGQRLAFDVALLQVLARCLESPPG
jgi:hypothetical protein